MECLFSIWNHAVTGHNGLFQCRWFGNEFMNIMRKKLQRLSVMQKSVKEGEWRTLVSQRLTPPNAVMIYMITIAIWTSVTSTLQKPFDKIQFEKKITQTDRFNEFSRISREQMHSQSEAECSRHVRLPVCAEKHEHAHKATKKHPVRVSADPTGYTRSHSNKH